MKFRSKTDKKLTQKFKECEVWSCLDISRKSSKKRKNEKKIIQKISYSKSSKTKFSQGFVNIYIA